MVDVTDQRLASEELRHSEQRYRTLFERSSVPMWEEDFSSLSVWLDQLSAAGITDLRAFFADHPGELDHAIGLIRIVDVNDAAVRFVGAHSRRDLRGGFPPELLNENVTQALLEQMVALWEDNDHLSIEISGKTVAGMRIDSILNWVVAGVPGAPHRVLVSVCDVTGERQVESALRKMLESKSHLIDSVAHELRTPLTAIHGFALELDTRWNDHSDAERRDLAQVIARQSARVNELVEDLVVAARLDGGELALRPASMDLSAMTEAVIEARTLDGDARFELALAPTTIWADPVRVIQILRNLVDNAVRHGGPHVDVTISRQPSSASLVIRDSGEGIPSDGVERAFEPYVTGDPTAHPATIGIGLSVARELARRMGGNLVYEHEEKSFVLTLPTERAEQAGA